MFVICAEIEQEIAELEDDEKKMFLDDLGIEESGLEKLIKASYELLGLMSYLTAGEDETRAWTIKWERKHRRQQERSIPILREDLSKQKLSTIKIFWNPVPMQVREKKVWSAWKEKSMW